MSDILFVNDTDELINTLERNGMRPVDMYINGDANKGKAGLYASDNNDDEVVERSNVCLSMNVVSNGARTFDYDDEPIEWNEAYEDMDPNEDAGQWV